MSLSHFPLDYTRDEENVYLKPLPEEYDLTCTVKWCVYHAPPRKAIQREQKPFLLGEREAICIHYLPQAAYLNIHSFCKNKSVRTCKVHKSDEQCSPPWGSLKLEDVHNDDVH